MVAWEGLCAPYSNQEHKQPAEYVFITSNTNLLYYAHNFLPVYGFLPSFPVSCSGRFHTGEQLTPGLNVSWKKQPTFRDAMQHRFPC